MRGIDPEAGLQEQLRQQSSMKQTILVLLACSILQLPIWGFAMTFGIIQDAYHHQALLHGSRSATGVIGSTLNGVMYLSMPVLSTLLDSGHWARWRRSVAIAGLVVESAAFFISAWCTELWQLIVLQGIFAALGGAMLFSPLTLMIDEWFSHDNRATAYGVQLSSKNIVGTALPFLMNGMLEWLGLRGTLRVWAGIVFATGVVGIFIMPQSSTAVENCPRKIPWAFLRHRTFYIYAIGNAVFSSGYGLPQTYMAQYATDVLHLDSMESSLTLVALNAPGILSCIGFGLLSDKFGLSASTNTLISTLGSGLCVLLLWGLKSHKVVGLLIAFSAAYGFFAGGYSGTWGGWIKEFEKEAAEWNESINTGMLYGLMNGARGVGFVVGGLVGVELLNAGPVSDSRKWAYGTKYGAVILFTGISAILGGWASVWSACGHLKWQREDSFDMKGCGYVSERCMRVVLVPQSSALHS